MASIFMLTRTEENIGDWHTRFEGKQKTRAMGVYPTVSLREARRRHDEVKELLAHGLDPMAEKKRVKVQAAIEEAEQSLTFERVAREWCKHFFKESGACSSPQSSEET